MNWKLIVALSLFGLAMGLATVFFIPSSIEPFCWLGIFVFSAYMIAKECSNRRFLHGVLVGLGNCVWITSVHCLLFNQYAANHPQEVAMMGGQPLAPRVMMAVTGPVIGLVSGLIIGLFALLAGRLMRPAVVLKSKASSV